MSSVASPVLVTGATGFIGRRLLRSGDRALVRRPAANTGEVQAALEDPVGLTTACRGIAGVFHCAGYAHAFNASDPEAHWRINYQGTVNLLEAAGRTGVKSFVFLSSVKAMAEPGDECIDEDWPGEPKTPYGIAKRAAESAVLDAGAKYGMHVVNLRLALVYGAGGHGNLERMARGIRGGWFPPLPETASRRSLVHVDDVVNAIRAVASHPSANGRTYIVAHPRPHSGRELYDAIRRVLSLERRGCSYAIPVWLLRAGGRVGDVLGYFSQRNLPLSSETVSRLLDSACYSPARIERELGWKATVDLESGLSEMCLTQAERQALMLVQTSRDPMG